MQPRINMITLGSKDLASATKFYQHGLGLPRMDFAGDISFFELNGSWLALYPWEVLAQDAQVDGSGTGFRGFTLAHNVANENQVIELLEKAKSAGATIVKVAQKTAWGGFAGYFADLDGHLWEIAHNPFFWPGPKDERNNKDNVYKSYETIAHWFDEHRSREFFEKAWCDKAIAYLTKGAAVLDLGCGMGEPIAQYFIDQGFAVTGVDGSAKLLELAKKRVANATFILGDMRTINLKQKFDLIIAWHSFFHLSQDDQRSMFKLFARHLNIGGILMFTTGTESGEIWSDNGGENIYHASLAPDEYQALLTAHDFVLLDNKIEDPDCGGATVWLAQKIL